MTITKEKEQKVSENEVSIEQVIKEAFPLNANEYMMKICKITNINYRLNFWTKTEQNNNVIVRSLWIKVTKTLDGYVCEEVE